MRKRDKIETTAYTLAFIAYGLVFIIAAVGVIS